MDFGEILSRAWQIIWKHKVLWIFGILAGCSSAGGSNTGYSFTRRENFPIQEYYFEDLVNRMQGWQIALIVGTAILVILVITLLVIFLSTIGKIGLIKGTNQIEKGGERLVFGELFSASGNYFWRVFLLNLIFGLAVAAGVIMLLFLYISASIVTLGIAAICLLPFLCLLVPFGWLLGLVLEQAIIAIIVEDLGIVEGFQRGWEVFTKNLGTMLVMGIILFLVGLVAGAIMGLPMLLVVGPAVAGTLVGTRTALDAGLIIALVCFVAYLPLLLLLSGILNAFTNSAWTLTFLRLTGKKPEPTAELQPEEL